MYAGIVGFGVVCFYGMIQLDRRDSTMTSLGDDALIMSNGDDNNYVSSTTTNG